MLETRENRKQLTTRNANILYLIALLLLLTVGKIVQEWNFNYGILITEICLIALPAICLVIFKRAGIRETFRIKLLKPMDMLLVFLIFIFGYVVAAFVNLVGDAILSIFGQLIVPEIPIAKTPHEYIVLLLVIAVSAGICEELLFRGVIMKAYQGLGMWGSIVFTALLFSMMHLNIQNIFATLYLGIILGFVVYKTNSIFAGMLGHFLNNAVSVTIGYVMMNLPIYKNMSPEVMKAGMNTSALWLSAMVFGIISLFFGTIVGLCMYALSSRAAAAGLNSQPGCELSEIRLGKLLLSAKTSWPLYISLVIFMFVMVLEFFYIRTGAPLKLF